jgi:hypothetical protein
MYPTAPVSLQSQEERISFWNSLCANSIRHIAAPVMEPKKKRAKRNGVINPVNLNGFSLVVNRTSWKKAFYPAEGDSITLEYTSLPKLFTGKEVKVEFDDCGIIFTDVSTGLTKRVGSLFANVNCLRVWCSHRMNETSPPHIPVIKKGVDSKKLWNEYCAASLRVEVE